MLFINVKAQIINHMPQTKEVNIENIPADRTIVRVIRVAPQAVPIIRKSNHQQ